MVWEQEKERETGREKGGVNGKGCGRKEQEWRGRDGKNEGKKGRGKGPSFTMETSLGFP